MANVIGDITFQQASAQRVVVDNSEYVDRVNQAAIQKVFQRPTSTVVLTQDPPPGTPVPLGTQINLTLIAKEEIPTQVLGVPTLQTRWPTVGDVESAIDTGGAALQAILDKGIEYGSLTAGDKEVVDTFTRSQFANQPAPPDPKALLSDMMFVNGL